MPQGRGGKALHAKRRAEEMRAHAARVAKARPRREEVEASTKLQAAWRAKASKKAKRARERAAKAIGQAARRRLHKNDKARREAFAKVNVLHHHGARRLSATLPLFGACHVRTMIACLVRPPPRPQINPTIQRLLQRSKPPPPYYVWMLTLDDPPGPPAGNEERIERRPHPPLHHPYESAGKTYMRASHRTAPTYAPPPTSIRRKAMRSAPPARLSPPSLPLRSAREVRGARCASRRGCTHTLPPPTPPPLRAPPVLIPPIPTWYARHVDVLRRQRWMDEE